jgi:ribose/xylose/arabinose/galactoside ABC-type transport system permease subunit
VSSINTRHDAGDPRQPRLDWLLIMSCLPVLVVAAVVLIIAGGFNLSFFFPAVVVGVMLGMLVYISIRDRRPT